MARKPMFGPDGKPMFGATEKPLLCEPETNCCGSPPETNCEVFSCTKKWREDLFVTWSGHYLAPLSGFEAVAPDMVNGSATVPFVGTPCTWQLYLPATFGAHNLTLTRTGCPDLTRNYAQLDVLHRIEVTLGGGLAIPQFFSRLDPYLDTSFTPTTYDWTDCSGTPQTSNLGFTGGSFGVTSTQTQAHWTINCNARTATWDNPSGTGSPGIDSVVSGFNACVYSGFGCMTTNGIISLSKRLKLDQVVINF